MSKKVWTDYPDMVDPNVRRWMSSNKGDIISAVTRKPGKIRVIDGELRCCINEECFIIPCTLRIVEKMHITELVKVAERRYALIMENK